MNAVYLIVVSLVFAQCCGRPTYPVELPNGNAYIRPDSGLACPNLGHFGCGVGRYTLNHFAYDFENAGYKWTKEFCETDSDGDGVTNGAELGDPCCVYSAGDTPARLTDLSYPGDPYSTPKAEVNRVCIPAIGRSVSNVAATTSTSTPAPCPSPMRSPTPSPSPTKTPAPSPSPTKTPAPSPSPTKTPVPSPSPTRTPKSSPSPTPSASPTRTPAPSASPTPSALPTRTPSPSASPTLSYSTVVTSDTSATETTIESSSQTPATSSKSKVTPIVTPNPLAQSPTSTATSTPTTCSSPKMNNANRNDGQCSTENGATCFSPTSGATSTPTRSSIASSRASISPYGPRRVFEEPENVVIPSPPSAPLCFPGNALVRLDSGITVAMKELRVGDRIAVGRGVYSEVFMFTHALRDVQHEFVYIETSSGTTLSLSEGHYLYANGDLIPAMNVKVGDELKSEEGERTVVKSISRKRESGLFNPQTKHGDVIVNGITTSTYTSATGPLLAHSLLAPLRGLYAALGYSNSMLNSENHLLGEKLREGFA